MLTTTTSRQKRLSPQEQLARNYEDTNERLDRYRLADHDTLKDVSQRMGRVMTHNEFIQRVQKVTHNRVWAEDSLSDPTHMVCGFYFVKDGVKKYVCSFDKGWMPEFSFILTDNADLPVKERRGWRTVLTRLLQLGAITWDEVRSAFGDGLSHATADRWAANTRQIRSR